MVMQGPAIETRATIGKLCVGGDWACAHGDFGALRHVARQLAGLIAEPTQCELVALEEACLCDLSRAVMLWCEIKTRLLRGSGS
jgi:hypothetical protein